MIPLGTNVQWMSNKCRIWVCPTKTFKERNVNVKSLSRINVIFWRNAVVPFSSLLVLNVQKTYTIKRSLNIISVGRVSFDMTNSNRVDVMSKCGLNVQNWRYINVIFLILPDQEGRNFTGSEAKQNNFLNISINVWPKYILLQGHKTWEGNFKM